MRPSPPRASHCFQAGSGRCCVRNGPAGPTGPPGTGAAAAGYSGGGFGDVTIPDWISSPSPTELASLTIGKNGTYVLAAKATFFFGGTGGQQVAINCFLRQSGTFVLDVSSLVLTTNTTAIRPAETPGETTIGVVPGVHTATIALTARAGMLSGEQPSLACERGPSGDGTFVIGRNARITAIEVAG